MRRGCEGRELTACDRVSAWVLVYQYPGYSIEEPIAVPLGCHLVELGKQRCL